MIFQIFSDEYFMNEALKEANKAFENNEIPIGAIIVSKNRIIAKAHNLTEKLNDTTAHAEILAITSASEAIGGKYLVDCVLYVTLEPCAMCGGALFWSKIDRVVYAASDIKKGFSNYSPNILHPKTKVTSGILAFESENLIKSFFAKKR